jgi:hypothetical protein
MKGTQVGTPLTLFTVEDNIRLVWLDLLVTLHGSIIHLSIDTGVPVV